MDFAEAMADQLTHCYASTRGCKKLPVRMVSELSPSGDNVIDMVMLCEDHAVTYKPEGKVLSDNVLADENMEAAKKARW